MNDGIYTLVCFVTVPFIAGTISYFILSNTHASKDTLFRIAIGMFLFAAGLVAYYIKRPHTNIKILITVLFALVGAMLIMQIFITDGHTIYDGVPY